ncbi:MAG: hypothetical protein B7Z37_19605 [Verrucomicrobia bacterium 12-59-8]|nr:MAG: hypothetical protein B7Z37_19605 [Verrucomicrobia bacterium 12-59-8]
MGSTSFQVRLTDSALNDLHEIDNYWCQRGEQYIRKLIEKAETELSSPLRAQSGRPVRVAIMPDTREIQIFKGSYKIIYRIDPVENVVHILRFWHGHRNELDLDEGRKRFHERSPRWRKNSPKFTTLEKHACPRTSQNEPPPFSPDHHRSRAAA